MAYRKIVVDGKQYEYVVGKSHVKIKGIGAFPKQGTFPSYVVPDHCDCCGEYMSDIYGGHVDPVHVQVHPKELSEFIKARVAV